jgi:beta-lactam-binding protein with PASTA domain
MTINEAEREAAKNSLNIQVIDSVFLSKHKKGSVIDQNPPPDFKVKKNRTVFLTINAFLTEKVKMPNLVGISQRQAEATIENIGLKTGKIEYIPDIAVNNVLGQKYRNRDIPEGTLIEKGSSIDLVLGKGLSEEETFIPDLTGLTKNEALTVVEADMLQLGAVICDETIRSKKDSATAKIWKQSPSWEKSKVVKLGTSIHIWLSLDESKLPVDTVNTSDN